MTILSVREALGQALREEFDRDEKVFLMGEDIGIYGGCFGISKGLRAEYGPERVIDTPLAESVIVGAGVGAALKGYRPVVEIMFADFLSLAMDQLVNNAAKMIYMHDGETTLPLVIRTPQGGGLTLGPHHSQCIESWLLNVPGLKIVLPSSPYNAKGLLKSAIRDNNPVVFLENKLLYNDKGEVPDGEYTVPIGKADIARPGKDITVLTYSTIVKKALTAADALAKEGIDVEVVDILTLKPLDVDTIIKSVKKTGKAIIAHEAPVFGGAGAEIAATIQQEAFDYLDKPIGRVGSLPIPVPFSPTLEQAYLLNEQIIMDAVRKTITR